MKTAKILTSIEEALKYLDMAAISYETTYKRKELQPRKYSDIYYQTFHDGNYEKTFIVASENRDFDIMLEDGSLFQFTARNENDIHYDAEINVYYDNNGKIVDPDGQHPQGVGSSYSDARDARDRWERGEPVMV